MEIGDGDKELEEKCSIPTCISRWEYHSNDDIKLCKFHYYYLASCPAKLEKYVKYGSRLSK